jgi:geranylgeranylglycerol-phosphate geranylgeranyltransferase
LTFLTSIRGFVWLARPRHCIVGTVFVIFGLYLTGSLSELLSTRFLEALPIVPLIIAYSFIINDYKDFDLDKISKPKRPLPAYMVPPTQALLFAVIVVATALILAWSIGVAVGTLATVNVLLSTLYSYRLKRTLLLGNIAIATLNSTLILYPGIIVGALTTPLLLVAFFVFNYCLAFEVLYAVDDSEGDELGGVHTTAVRIGMKTSLQIVRLLIILAIGGTLIPWLMGIAAPYYLVPTFFFTILPALWIVFQLSRHPDRPAITLTRKVMTLTYYTSALPIIFLYHSLR